MLALKPNALLKENIKFFLKERGLNQRGLARYLRRDTSDPKKLDAWISKLLNDPSRDVGSELWERLQDYLGVSMYQLLQPGHAEGTERRKAERRSGKDRRTVSLSGARTPKPAVVNIVDILNVLDRERREAVLSHAVDELNDQMNALRRRRTTRDDAGGRDRTGETNPPNRIPKGKKQA